MIYDSILQCIGGTPLVRLSRLFPSTSVEVLAKLEFLNPGGSVKDRPARHILEHGLRSGFISQDSRLVESTSGNLGVALSMASKIHKLQFTAVVDPNIAATNLAIMQQMGAATEMVSTPDAAGGYLGSRIAMVNQILATDKRAIWVNQYANSLNEDAHFVGTGEELVADLDSPPDVLVLAVSTGGTIMGIARRLRAQYPNLLVIGVDVVGSVIFGGPPGPRKLPGIGASRRPELIDSGALDRVVHVTEQDCITNCHDLLAKEGILAGASSGAVLAAIRQLASILPKPSKVVTLFPDRGERYMNTVFDQSDTARYKLTQSFNTL